MISPRDTKSIFETFDINFRNRDDLGEIFSRVCYLKIDEKKGTKWNLRTKRKQRMKFYRNEWKLHNLTLRIHETNTNIVQLLYITTGTSRKSWKLFHSCSLWSNNKQLIKHVNEPRQWKHIVVDALIEMKFRGDNNEQLAPQCYPSEIPWTVHQFHAPLCNILSHT